MDAEDAARSLYSSLTQIPEPRSDRGRRHPLAAILTLIVLASLDGAASPASIAEWGRRQSPRLIAAMGFRRAQTPSGTTLRNVINRIDGEAFARVFREWIGRDGLPDGFDIRFDASSSLRFRVLNRVTVPSTSPGMTTTLNLPPKRVPQLRRWRRRD